MRIDQIAALATSHFLSRLIRRAAVAVALAVFAIVAVYHFTVAGEIALAEPYGTLIARLIVGSVYAAITLVTLVVLWVMGRRHGARAATPALSHNARELQFVMLVEAVMLGYSLARKRERTG